MCRKAVLILFSLMWVFLAGTAEAVTDSFVASGTWVAPAGVTSVTVEAWGGGGAGGGNPTNTDGGGGGGGGAYSKTTVAVTPGNSYTVTVGAGGLGGAGTGGAGGDSWFSTITTILAKGGTGGAPPAGGSGNGGVGGVGGAAALGIGTTKFSGGNGGTGRGSNTGRGGPGGSSAGTAANGTSGPVTWTTATAAAAPAGGGIGGDGGNRNRQDGFAPASGNGGGGGGGAERSTIGGDGAVGMVAITYTLPATVLSINTASANPTTAASVSWTVIFNTSVSGVSSGNFTLVNSGLGGAPAITSVTGSGTTWTVTASTGTGSGTLGLNMTSTTGVSPAITGLPFTGQIYSVRPLSVTANPTLCVNDASIGVATGNWTGLTNVGTQDNVYATASVANTDITNYLKCTGYGFSIPAGATITGITVGPWVNSTYTMIDNAMQLVKSGVIQATNLASGANTFPNGGGTFAGSPVQLTYGGAPGVWGGTWTPADINNINFGAAFAAQRGGFATTQQAAVDAMPITVTYTLSSVTAAVLSINRANPSPTSAPTVSWTVVFDRSVTGVDASAFTLAASGINGAFITTVTGSGTTWTITANTGIGAGTLGLNQTGPGAISPTLSGTFTGQIYTISATPALAEYRMDEAGWSGIPGEVVDTSGSYPGTAMNNANTTDGLRAIPGDPGTCRYGIFDDSNAGGSTITQGYVALPGFPNLNTDFTITAWINTPDNTVGAQRIFIDDETNTGGYGLSLGEGGTGVLRFYTRGSSAIILDTPLDTIGNDAWYFIAGVADISNGIRRIYVYDAAGNLLPGMPVSVASTGWGIDAGMASIGGETNASSEPPATHHFMGNIDEVRVYQKILNQSALAALAKQTHACSGGGGVAPGGFNAYETSTAPGAITGVIKTKVSGSAASVDIVALNATRTAVFNTFTGTVRVDILDSSNNSGVLDSATGCRSSWTAIQTLTPDPVFLLSDNGRKTVSFSVPNAYRDARVRVTFPAGLPTVTGCSTDNFAIRPSALTAFAVSDDGTPTNAGTVRALNDASFGAVIHKAGRPFSVRASAVNAAGAPAITTNYTGTPSAILSTCVGAACTASTGTLSVGTAFTAGQLITDVASYDNVGSYSLQLVDGTFSAVDSSDSTAAEREIRSAVINVGRFVPDHFSVALNTPAFGTACVAGAFTYAGQAFNYTTAPVITLQARNFANAATTFYTGNWWRIISGSLTGKTYAAASGTLVTTGVPGVDPVISDAGSGSGSLTFSSGSGLSFTRAIPVVPFDAEIGLAINLIDTDGVVYESPTGTPANPVRFGQASAGNGIAFSSGKPVRFGRLRLSNNSGAPTLPLQLMMETQYWASTGAGASFITNTADSCTALAAANIAMSGYTKNLNACNASLTVGGFSGGRATAQLSPPGSSNAGSVNLTVNLGAGGSGSTCISGSATPVSGANRAYLQGNWSGAAYDQNPAGIASFGVYTDSNEIIDIRENY